MNANENENTRETEEAKRDVYVKGYLRGQQQANSFSLSDRVKMQTSVLA
jgi:hypothetical protein